MADRQGAHGAPDSHIAQLVEIHGDLDRAVLLEAAAQVAAEAAAPRSRRTGEGPEDPPLPVVDLSTEPDPPGAADAWVRAALGRNGEGSGPDQALLRLGPDRHHWFHRHDRAVVDRFGCALITRRVSEVYTALTQGRPPAHGALATRAQLAAATAGYAGSPAQEADRAHWRGRLTGLPEPVTFARAPVRDADGPRAAVDSRPVELSATVTERLRATARDAGVPARAVLSAAVAAYAHRLSGVTDLVIGLPVDGRPSRVGRRVPGTSEYTVPLRLTVRPADTFAGLVRDVARESREAISHQRLGHRELCRAAGAPDDRSPSYGPVADFRAAGAPVRFGELSSVVHELVPEPVHDVRVVLEDGPAGPLRIVFSGAADRYTPAELDEHAQRFGRLLARSVAAPDQPSRAPAHTLTELLESAARSHPDAVAVIGADGRLSYRELHERANRLARLLLDRGAGPESVVGLLLPRSAGTLVAMLAVLKAGAAYLPLDPGYPAERLRLMIEDAEPRCVLTDTATAPYTAHGTNGASLPDTFVRLDDPSVVRELERLSPTAPSDADRPEPLRPAHPAYVIHTSGSTGTPKGVVVPHLGAVELVGSATAEFGADSLAHSLAATSFGFDMSVAEIFPALAAGGCVEVVGSLLSLLDEDPPRWSGGLLCAVPSVLSKLMESGGLQVSATTVAMCGEPLPAALAARIREVMPGTRLLNMYGPTEATVYATSATVRVPEGPPPIGRPLGHMRAYVLDSSLQRVEAGGQGELYLAGSGLARGYLRRPGPSAERFVADPFGPPGERMYRTGDLAALRPDGQLEFLGRADAQVKVNGFRVEPGEVEAVLARHPDVGEAMVRLVTGEGTNHGARLVAHLVPSEGARLPGGHALRDWAAERLPAHLVPAELKEAAALPRTGGGKLDRGRTPTEVRHREGGPPTADGPGEERVARVFREVLGVPEVPTDVSFFDLGGDSIMSVRLLHGLRRAGLVLTPQDIFEHQSVAALARTARGTDRTEAPAATAGPADGGQRGIRERPAESGTTVLLPLRESGDLAPLFCVHPAAGFPWCYAGLTSPLGADRPVYGLQARGLDGPDALPASLREMAADYLDQIRSVRPTGPYHLLGWSFGGVIAHEMAVQLEESGESVETLAILDAYPLDGGTVDAAASAEAAPGSVAGQDILGMLLELFGHDPTGWAGESLTYPRFVEIARAQGGLLSSFDEERVAALARTFTNSTRIAGLHEPRPFGGDAVLFTAREHAPGTALCLWRPLVEGALEALPVDCAHSEMGSPAVLGDIGRVLVGRWDSEAAQKGSVNTP
ncbi:amino acid adenylation domain-containing protein [Streptomyces sp. NPDC057900]|uniref:amino acid adenylation domain-containing protein n=1 Tax=Streptomyces sp. NPDC057900 TaxID=3346274 RepID=UPI0036EA0C72